MIGYRDILLQYINEHEPEQPILTKQVAQYVAAKIGMEDENVKKAVFTEQRELVV